MFSFAERHTLTTKDGLAVQVFQVQLTDVQHQVLGPLGIPQRAFRSTE
jgi:hypothetical protein